MGAERIKTANIAFAMITFLIMVMISYFWGNLMYDFGNSYGGTAGFIIMIMVTFALIFGTFVVPLLIYKGIFVNPFNIIQGLGFVLFGIPMVIFIVEGLSYIIEAIGLTGDLLMLASFLEIILIIFIGFIAPIMVMLEEETFDMVSLVGAGQ